MSNLLKNLLIALGIAILLWVGYTFFIKGEGDALLTSSSGTLSAQAQFETQELLAKAQKLSSFDIDGDILNDPRFVSLESFRIELIPELVGRTNPFAPIQ
jgi:hypothetical protein